MKIKYLNIDNDVNMVDNHAVIWKKRSIGVDRVDTMTEGIQKLLLYDKYICVAVNGDTVDFMPLLKAMRSVTNTPILIGTDNFTTEKEIAALESGADLYARFHDNEEGNIASVLAHINRVNVRSKEKIPGGILTHGDILIIEENQQAFIKNEELNLTKTEMKVFYYLLLNRGTILTYEKILEYIWSYDDDKITTDNLYNIVKKLRQKIRVISEQREYIETVKNVGYRISTGFGEKI